MTTYRYTVASPRLSHPLEFERDVPSSENVIKMFALRFLMTEYPGDFDMEDLFEFKVTEVVV